MEEPISAAPKKERDPAPVKLSTRETWEFKTPFPATDNAFASRTWPPIDCDEEPIVASLTDTLLPSRHAPETVKMEPKVESKNAEQPCPQNCCPDIDTGPPNFVPLARETQSTKQVRPMTESDAPHWVFAWTEKSLPANVTFAMLMPPPIWTQEYAEIQLPTTRESCDDMVDPNSVGLVIDPPPMPMKSS